MITGAILSPFIVALLALWLVPRWPASARLLAAWPALLAGLLAAELRRALVAGPRVIELEWAPSLGLSLSFNLDALGLLFAVLITGIGALVVLYASRYLEGHPHAGRFNAYLFAFMGAMLGVALSDNVFTLFVFWELTGFTSFLLIGFEHEREDARTAATQALIVTGGGGLALLAAGVLLQQATGTASLGAMAAQAETIAAHPMATAVAGLVLLAAFTKSAQVPFHFWLPNAMAAPTPVSAYLHSATMVKAGIYLVARMSPILAATASWGITVAIVGAVTMVVGAYRAVQEVDLKRILAYSTVSALGVLTMLLGVGTPEAITAALVYLLAHACYKGALFLVAGTLDHETGTRDVTVLTGLRRAMPLTALAGGAAALSMAGVPLTLGFVGKDAAYEALLHGGQGAAWLLGAMVVASVLLGLAGLLAGVGPFVGEQVTGTAATAGPTLHERAANTVEVPPFDETGTAGPDDEIPEGPAAAGDAAAVGPAATVDLAHAHEAGWEMWLPPLALATCGLVLGVLPLLTNGPVAAAASAIAGTPVPVALAVWHGLTPALLLSVVTLIGVGLAYAGREVIRTRTPVPTLGSERLYTWTLAALDATGRAIAPALHSASLRSYVMAVVMTTVVVTGATLLTSHGMPAVDPVVPVRVHEVMIVSVVILGALGATLARTTMAAVLSLGAVGYGVAMTFLLFGAPDLAMTQFSVETLTVVIYVLVFRRFRKLGALSPRLVRARDGVIAAGLGIVVGGLALSVAKVDTAARLREYFVEYGPTIGHGRNIVNVILVDFRAFDTMGESTVRATAAIGVRALLLLAAAGRPDRRPSGNAPPATSAIFRTAARVLMPLLLLFALFLLLRGHNQPGGGFVGGLVAAAAFALYGIAYGVERARRALLVEPLTLLGIGLLVALMSGLPAVLQGRPFLSAVWSLDPVTLGTPVVFDVGVFLVVTGVVLLMIFSLAEES